MSYDSYEKKSRYFRVFSMVNPEPAYSRPRLPLIPDEACHPFHAKAATDSTAKLPPAGCLISPSKRLARDN
jgi:hypothetical protein